MKRNDTTHVEHVAPDELIAQRIGIPVDSLDQDAVARWQVAAFNETWQYVRTHSKFYREQWSHLPDAITSLEELKGWPSVSETDLVGQEWRFQCISPSEVNRVVTVPTTGTAGNSKHIAFNEIDQARSLEFIQAGFKLFCHEGDRLLVLMSGDTPGGIGWAVRKAVAPIGVDTLAFGSVTDLAEAYRVIMDFRPQVIVGIPYQVAALARWGQAFSNPESQFIHSALLSADAVPDSVCQRLRNLWGCQTYRHYGMTEMAIFGGVECSAHHGYHMRGCDLLMEIDNPDANGYGELIITTLGRQAMPLVRYRTGDISRFLKEPCACGSKLYRLDNIRGRRNSRLPVPGNYYVPDVSELAFRLPQVIDFDLEADENKELTLVLRTLPGDVLSAADVREELKDEPLLREIPNIRIETSDRFPSGPNMKKRIRNNV